MTPLFEPHVQSSPNWHLIFLMPDLLWLLVGSRQTHVVGCPDFFCSVGFWWLVLYVTVVSSVSDCCVDCRVRLPACVLLTFCAQLIWILVTSRFGVLKAVMFL